MTEKAENKVETLPDLDDLLQCPVCYEIPSGQIFQCNEGHHVCGRCKMRLDVCPVCRAFFFGTRNYAMEELISNVRKLRAFKLGGKITTGSPPAEETPEVVESSSEEIESTNDNGNEDDDASSRTSSRAPAACRGLFRCLCCKNNPERLPLARLLNHLRYYHSPDLIEGRSENGGYLQAWQFPTVPGKIVTAVRVHDMGIFFLVIEVAHESVHAWLCMAASPWVAHEFSYSFTLSGNDREAIFSDSVWSVRSCEGTLKRRGRCLSVSGQDARALLSPSGMNGKLSVRRTPLDLQPHSTEPRAVLRVANRSNVSAGDVAHNLEPFLQDLQNDVAILSRAFATLGREANALVRSEAEMRARLETAAAAAPSPPPEPSPPPSPAPPPPQNADRQMSRSARRRMRQRLREAFRVSQPSEGDAASPNSDNVARTPPHVHRPGTDRPRANGAQPASDITRLASSRQVNQQLGSTQNARPQVNHAVASTQNARPQANSTQNVRPQANQVVGSTQNARPQVHRVGYIQVAGPQSNQGVNAARGASRANPGTAPQTLVRNDNPNVGVSSRESQRTTSGNRAAVETMSPSEMSTFANAFRSHVLGVSSGPPVPVAPPPMVPPPTVGGPSQERPANGNTRNKRKRRQRR